MQSQGIAFVVSRHDATPTKSMSRFLIPHLQGYPSGEYGFPRNDLSVGDFKLVKHRLYFIEFGSSCRLPRGQLIDIHDFESKGAVCGLPAQDIDTVDPYAYDVYALGRTFMIIRTVRGC